MAIKPGTHFKSEFGADIEIADLLGEGGQGFVYEIKYNGEPKALKIYKAAALKDVNAFYSNVKNNIQRGSPSPQFLWPEDLLPRRGNSFGYVMNLRPKGYEELGSYLCGKVKFASFKVITTAALHIVTAFRILHNEGYSYQDLNDGNFFINPNTGEVLICDNDNVAPNGGSTGILGKPRYMAPEIVRGETMPNTETDRFSLAVILFMMFTMTHPLEGKRYLAECLTPALEKKLYGTEPLFILNPTDRRNCPVQGVHTNIGMVWPELPAFMREAFSAAFSESNLMQPGRRITEAEWKKRLVRLRSGIFHCPVCGGDCLSFTAGQTACPGCGAKLPPFCKMKLSNCDYEIPLTPDTLVYRLQFSTARVGQGCKPILRVKPDPKTRGAMMLVNVSGEELECHTPSGKRRIVPAGAAIPANAGISISAYNGRATIEG